MTRVLLAGGGTGGHVFPLLAVADAFRRIAPAVDVHFVGTVRGLEARIVPARGYPLETLVVSPIKGRGARQVAAAVATAGRATVDAMGLVSRMRPSLVVSVGGYAAGPVGFAAALAGTKLALIEPNRTVGLTQRLLGPLARRVYVGFPDAARSYGKRGRAFGVPLREGFAPAPLPDDAVPTLLVMGGSQGSQHLNQVVPEAAAELVRRGCLRVVHQTGRGHGEAARQRWQQCLAPSGGERDLAAAGVEVLEFVDDVASRLSAAHLVLCRAGAMTCAELVAVGRPALFVPYPHAADDHQMKNARALEAHGAARVLAQNDATAGAVSTELSSLLADRSVLDRMAAAARALFVPDSADRIVRDLLALVDEPPGATAAISKGNS